MTSAAQLEPRPPSIVSRLARDPKVVFAGGFILLLIILALFAPFIDPSERIDRRQAIGLTIVEHGPTVLVAILLGIAFGLATFLALQPGLGLGAIVGSALTIPIDLSVARFGPLIVAIVAIVSLAMAVGIVVRREPASIAALRRGVE